MTAPEKILSAVTTRRTHYELAPELPTGVTITNIKNTIGTIIKDTPTAFNCQSNRALILTGAAHKHLWNTIAAGIDNEAGKKRPLSAANEAYGTVVFFTDDKTTENLQNQFPPYEKMFPVWAGHASGAAQMISWTTFESMGLGAHLQHYNPFVKQGLPSKADVSGWTVEAQLVFGKPAGTVSEKTFIENEVLVYN